MSVKSKRQRRTRQRQTRRRRKVRIVVGGGTHPELEEALKAYLTGLSKPLFIHDKGGVFFIKDTKCNTPQSKGGQKISICGKYVYKTPPSTNPEITSEGENVIRVDPYTMNLLIQSVVQTFPELHGIVETYVGLDGTGLRRRLIGEKYSLKYDGKNCFSVEDYIKTYNDFRIRIEQDDHPELNSFIEQLTTWIESIVKTLDKLWDKIQFHHCDPKAAQLFITETQEEKLDPNTNLPIVSKSKNVIVGDLDRVTFSMYINGTLVRVCSPNFMNAVIKTIGSVNSIEPQYSITLESAQPQPQSTYLGSVLSRFSRSASPAKAIAGGASHTVSSMETSFAEKMRSLTHPNTNNHLEIAAFISSILLLIDNPETKEDLYDRLNLVETLKKYIVLIDFDELKNNRMDFKGRSSHKTACHYVNSKVMGDSELKSDFHIPVATPTPVVATRIVRKALFPAPTPTPAPAQEQFVDL